MMWEGGAVWGRFSVGGTVPCSPM